MVKKIISCILFTLVCGKRKIATKVFFHMFNHTYTTHNKINFNKVNKLFATKNCLATYPWFIYMYSCVLRNETIVNSTRNKTNIIYFSTFVFLYSLSIQIGKNIEGK